MRLLALLALLAFCPAAAASQPLPTGQPYVDPDVEVSPDGCEDCVTVDLVAGVSEPPNCNDCGGIGAHAGVESDGDGTTVVLQVCRGGFVYICPVDEEITV